MANTPAVKHILLTGGTGGIGKHLAEALLTKGYKVSNLSRTPGKNARIQTFLWDVEKRKIDPKCIDGVDIVIHLAGAGIADKRWSHKRKKILIESRTESIRLIYELMRTRPNQIKAVLSASAIGYYGDRRAVWLTEESSPGKGFMPDCCIAWEKAVDEGKALGLRILKLRTGVVLDKDEGALPQMARPIKLYAGAAFGRGKQWVPWIHWQDAVDIYMLAIENKNLEGVFNMAAPNLVTNRQLMQAIARQLHKPMWLPNVPKFVFKLLMGEMSIIVLGSTRVSPQKIEDAGFQFKYPDLAGALEQLYGQKDAR